MAGAVPANTATKTGVGQVAAYTMISPLFLSVNWPTPPRAMKYKHNATPIEHDFQPAKSDLHLSGFGQALSEAGGDAVRIVFSGFVLAIGYIVALALFDKPVQDHTKSIAVVSAAPLWLLMIAVALRSFKPVIVAWAEIHLDRDIDGDGVIGDVTPTEPPTLRPLQENSQPSSIQLYPVAGNPGRLVAIQCDLLDLIAFVDGLKAGQKIGQKNWREYNYPVAGKPDDPDSHHRGIIQDLCTLGLFEAGKGERSPSKPKYNLGDISASLRYYAAMPPTDDLPASKTLP